jgi:hypothetical protein
MASVPTVAAFLENYPEFAQATTALVTAKLTDAAARTNADIFQSTALATQAVMLRAAVLLLRSPYGLKMRQNNPDQAYTWEYELKALQRSATQGIRVFGY